MSVICRCDWCGKSAAEMPVYDYESAGGWISNPFYQRAPKFFACGSECKSAAESHYAEYRSRAGIFAGIMGGLFGAAFILAFIYGYPVFRWSFPAAIGLGGAVLAAFPYANSFRRDKNGSLKTPLKKSMREGRIAGVLFVLMSLILAYINIQLPSIFPIPVEAEPPPVLEKH